jgi:glycosyltransferase involved in cell wall biosynthesis
MPPFKERESLRRPVWFIVETSADARLIEGLADVTELTVLVRDWSGTHGISQTLRIPVRVLTLKGGRLRFGAKVAIRILTQARHVSLVLVQGYGAAAFGANLAGKLGRISTAMLVCSPIEAYYRCRRADPASGMAYRAYEMMAIKLMARLNAATAQLYIVLSDYLAQVVTSHRSRAPIVKCPLYGVNLDNFHPIGNDSRQRLRFELGFPRDGVLLFFSSRIAPEKDVDTLLVAVRQLVDEGRNVWLINTSGGHSELIERANRYGIHDRLIARPAVDPRRDLAPYYHAADICIQASREEGLGFSPLEALACGTPVVAAEVGGLCETIVDGVTGWTYPPGDPNALARVISQVVDDPMEATQRAAKGKDMVIARYESLTVFSKFCDLLDAYGR